MRTSSLMSFSTIVCSCLITALPLQSLFSYKPSTNAIQEVEHTLNTFSHAVDNHDFNLLELVFAPNATANFDDGRGTLRGLTAISKQLQFGLTGTITHHSLSTQLVRLTSPTTASAVSYLQGTFFGQGNLAGQISTTYGRYLDNLSLSALGWRVTNKTLIRTGHISNLCSDVSSTRMRKSEMVDQLSGLWCIDCGAISDPCALTG